LSSQNPTPHTFLNRFHERNSMGSESGGRDTIPNMEFSELAFRAIQIKELYAKANQKDNLREWGRADYAQGFVGDVGDLLKLIMARENLRSFEEINLKSYPNIDTAIAHELADCLWSILVLAHELNVDLEMEFTSSMRELEDHIVGRHSRG
jgi:NTP pyrophosphatase (non-canonical NTP hydrolase)